MNLYIVKHNGLWLGGYSLAFANSPDEAKKVITDMLNEKSYLPSDENGEFDIHIQREFINVIDPLKIRPHAHLIWDGDY